MADMQQIPDSDGLFHAGLSPGVDYLGSPRVVNRILRGALRAIVDFRGRNLAGGDVAAEAGRIAAGLQSIFYGQDAEYQGSHWHRPSGLGRALVERAGIGGDAADAVERLMLRMIAEYGKAYSLFESGVTSYEALIAEGDRIVNFYVRILVGASL